MMKWKKHLATITALIILLMFSITGSAGLANAASLDQNEEIQDVMGDLSALKTAAQMHFSDNPNHSRVPHLSSVLHYFDENSIPPDASSRYAISGDDRGWYVGYRVFGLRSGTLRQLEENAFSLGLVGDDLHSPWRRGNAYIWTNALTLSPPPPPSGGLVIRDSRRSITGFEVATVLIGAAVLINAINDRHCHRHHFYSHPGHSWRWRSTLVYRPSYRQRFYTRFSRPPARPVPIVRRPAPAPRPPAHREPPPRLRGNSRRNPSDVQRPPARRPDENRRSDGSLSRNGDNRNRPSSRR